MSSYPYLLPHVVNTISQQRLIVCEGYSDAIFVCELLKMNNITNCAVGCPSRAGGHGMGQDAIAQYLGAIRGSINLKKANLTHMLVVTDADHYCPVKTRTESVGWSELAADLCSPSSEVPVKWVFSRIR